MSQSRWIVIALLLCAARVDAQVVSQGVGSSTGAGWRMTLAASLPAGPNAIGHVTFDNTTLAVTNAGTFAVQATLAAETSKIIGTVNIAAAQSLAITGSVAVTGTFWQATQPVSGPLTDTQLRASAVPVSATNLDVALSTRLKPADTLTAVTTVGTITNVVHVDDNGGSLTIDNANLDAALSTLATSAKQPTLVSGRAPVDPSGVTSPVSLAALPSLVAGSAIVGKFGLDQTTPGTTNKVSLGSDVVHEIVDSGTVNATQGTPAALTSGWPTVSGTIAPVTGTLSATSADCSVANSCAQMSGIDGMGSLTAYLNGSTTFPAMNLSWEMSFDGGTVWAAARAVRYTDNTYIQNVAGSMLTGAYLVGIPPGATNFRVRVSSYTSDSYTFRLTASARSLPMDQPVMNGFGSFVVSGPLTATQFNTRINTLGQKTMSASTPVVLSSDQTSVPAAATLAAETTKVIGTVNIAAGQAITANAGSQLNTSLLALEAGGNLALTATNTRVRGTSSAAVMVMATDLDATLLAANSARVQWQVCNQSRSPMLVKFGTGATRFSYNVRVESGRCYMDASYTGQINAVWDPGADQFAMVSETQ